MDRANIDKIFLSNLWNKIQNNQHYLTHTIVETQKGNKKHFCALFVFFKYNISNETIQKYWLEGRRMINNELLDNHGNLEEVYGIKMLVFS